MGFTLTAYDEIKKNFDRKLLSFLGHHEVADVEKLPVHRRGYVEFVQQIIVQLDKLPAKSSEKETREQERLKSMILSGVMYIIADGLLPSSGSLLRDVLIESMGVRDEDKKKDIQANKVDANSAARMTSEAMKFYTSLVFPHGNTEKMLEVHPFSKIEGMSLSAFEVKAIDMGAEARKKVLSEGRAAIEKEVYEREQAKKGPSLFAKMGSTVGGLIWSANTKKSEEEEDYVDDHDSKLTTN
ncbi:hypothetical protein [Legionella cardiaca]|uniref:Dot/Icm T4SS effector n=1 Tax=Legionella cardiaca TaxID=1071983 RepID=A0ABY8AP24_9GAMM|nr:hypothetical protein [Legionella cardiaca]WED42298.1 hypothetical protein PXX05_10200 [Legionella cardiaca]